MLDERLSATTNSNRTPVHSKRARKSIVLNNNSVLYDALESTAEETGVSIKRVFEAAILFFVDYGYVDFVMNPNDSRYRWQTEEEEIAMFARAARTPEEADRIHREFLETEGQRMSDEDRQALLNSMNGLNDLFLKTKADLEVIESVEKKSRQEKVWKALLQTKDLTIQ